METMVETAFITATRFARKPFVIVGSDQTQFLKPIPESGLAEEMYTDKRELSAVGVLSLVALDEEKKPTLIIDK